LQQDGKLIWAGRTLTIAPNGMSIVIFVAGSETEARTIIESDDAVQAKIMAAQLFPFHLALLRQP